MPPTIAPPQPVRIEEGYEPQARQVAVAGRRQSRVGLRQDPSVGEVGEKKIAGGTGSDCPSRQHAAVRVLAGLAVLAAFLACAVAAWAVYEWAWHEPAVEDDSAVRAQVLAGNFALLQNAQSVESLERISQDLWFFELGEGCSGGRCRPGELLVLQRNGLWAVRCPLWTPRGATQRVEPVGTSTWVVWMAVAARREPRRACRRGGSPRVEHGYPLRASSCWGPNQGCAPKPDDAPGAAVPPPTQRGRLNKWQPLRPQPRT